MKIAKMTVHKECAVCQKLVAKAIAQCKQERGMCAEYHYKTIIEGAVHQGGVKVIK